MTPGSRALTPDRVAALLAGTPAADWRVLGGGVTGSTQDDARALANAGEGGPVVVLAERQTAGRGRFDRGWESPAGGVYFSALVRPELAPSAVPVLALAAGLGVARGIEAEFGALGIGLKWPNDLRLAGEDGTPAKLAGILAQSSVAGERLSWVVIGCGINVARPGSPPPGAVYLSDVLGPDLDPARVAAAAVVGMAAALAELSLVGFEPMAGDYAARSDIIQTEVTVRDEAGRPIASGVVEGFDETGRLVLRADGAEVHIAAGDVTLRG